MTSCALFIKSLMRVAVAVARVSEQNIAGNFFKGKSRDVLRRNQQMQPLTRLDAELVSFINIGFLFSAGGFQSSRSYRRLSIQGNAVSSAWVAFTNIRFVMMCSQRAKLDLSSRANRLRTATRGRKTRHQWWALLH